MGSVGEGGAPLCALQGNRKSLGLCKVDLLGTIFEGCDLLKVDLVGNGFGRF